MVLAELCVKRPVFTTIPIMVLVLAGASTFWIYRHLGVGVDAIASSLRTMVGGEEVTKFKEADDQHVVRLRLQEDFRKNAGVIGDLYVPSAKLGLVKLNNVVRITEENGPNQQVDYTNVLRERGLPRTEAILKADHARLRPILMTTISIIAGMLPIALGKGDGSASRAASATVVVGGQAMCLLLALLVTLVLSASSTTCSRSGPGSSAASPPGSGNGCAGSPPRSRGGLRPRRRGGRPPSTPRPATDAAGDRPPAARALTDRVE